MAHELIARRVEYVLFRFGDHEVDVRVRELRRRGAAIALAPRVFDFLLLLLRNHDRAVSNGEILDVLWKGHYATANALCQIVSAARRAVSDDGGSQSTIRTLRGYGYRLMPEVTAVSASCAPEPIGATDAPFEATASWSSYWSATTAWLCWRSRQRLATRVVAALRSSHWRDLAASTAAHGVRLIRFSASGEGLSFTEAPRRPALISHADALALAMRAAQEPALILVDELHRAAGAALDKLERFACGLAPSLASLVLAVRIDQVPPLDSLHGVLARIAAQGGTIRLSEPLSLADVERRVRQRMPEAPVVPLAWKIWRATGGEPFATRVVLRRADVAMAQNALLDDAIAPIVIPASVLASIRRSIGLLPDRVRVALGTAARSSSVIFGRQLAFELGEPAERALLPAIAAGLVCPFDEADDSYRFFSSFVRRAWLEDDDSAVSHG
jgi:DNA-binding winged helix-turn-helix (wHTH) protein